MGSWMAQTFPRQNTFAQAKEVGTGSHDNPSRGLNSQGTFPSASGSEGCQQPLGRRRSLLFDGLTISV